MAKAINIGGLWMGSYAYPAGHGPTTPFLARIEDRDGALSGTIIEPNTMGRSSDSLEAILSGSRHGSAVDFTKVYDGASDAAHAVDYVGRLSADGNTITGMWSLADANGSFEMYREAVWEEAEGQEAAVDGLQPVAQVGERTCGDRGERVDETALRRCVVERSFRQSEWARRT